MRQTKKNTIISVILLCIYIITYTVDYFTTKSIAIIPTLMCIGSLILFYIVLRKIDSIYYFGIVLFTGFALCLGQMFHLYRIIPIYDLLLHLASGILLVFFGHYIYTYLVSRLKESNIPLPISVLFCTLFSIASAGVWEIWEYSGDVLFGLTSQGTGLDDTMTDIIAGSIGAVMGAFLLFFLLRKRISKNNNTK